VEGFVVSFIAPHTLTARVLVVAPDDVLTVLNLSPYEAVYLTTDGRNVDTLEPGHELDVTFEHDQVLLAQVPGASFYHRFREKFGRLAY
jgi:NAD+ kinase